MNTDLNKDENFARLGSFWYKNMTQESKAQAKTFASLPLFTRILNQFDENVRRLQGDKKTIDDFRDKYQVVTITNDLRKFTQSNPYNSDITVYDNLEFEIDRTKPVYFLLDISEHKLIPESILTNQGLLIHGIGFNVAHNYIWFNEDITKLASNNILLFDTAVVTDVLRKQGVFNWYSYTDNASEVSDVNKYHRVAQSPVNLKNALANICNIPIVRQHGNIISKYTPVEGTIVYLTSAGEQLVIEYTHNELEVGDTVTPNQLIGNPIQVYTPRRDVERWWNIVDWSAGISMAKISNFKDLVIPGSPTYAYMASEDEGSVDGDKAHVRFRLGGGDFNMQELFWEGIAEIETESGYYLNNIVGFDEDIQPGMSPSDNYAALLVSTPDNEFPDISVLDQKKPVIPVDIYFEGLLKDHALVVVLDQNVIPEDALTDAIYFIREELPFGYIPLIRLKDTNGNIVDSIVFEDKDNLSYPLYLSENSIVVN